MSHQVPYMTSPEQKPQPDPVEMPAGLSEKSKDHRAFLPAVKALPCRVDLCSNVYGFNCIPSRNSLLKSQAPELPAVTLFKWRTSVNVIR